MARWSPPWGRPPRCCGRSGRARRCSRCASSRRARACRAAPCTRSPTTLAEEGLLDVVAGRGYRLGPLLVGLAGQIIERTGLVAAVEGAAPVRRTPGQEVHVGQLVGAWVVYLHREAGPVRAPMDNRVGLRAPAWRGGCGKAALSRLPSAEVDERIARLCREEDVPGPRRARPARRAGVGPPRRLAGELLVPAGSHVGGGARRAGGRRAGGRAVGRGPERAVPARGGPAPRPAGRCRRPPRRGRRTCALRTAPAGPGAPSRVRGLPACGRTRSRRT